MGASGRIVYIVEADESVRESLARLGHSAGLESRPCASIEAFLDRVSSAQTACAVLDITNLRPLDPSLRSQLRALAEGIPIIALSARDDPETLRAARELGAQAFFRKPVDAAALLDSIDWVTRAEWRGNSD